MRTILFFSTIVIHRTRQELASSMEFYFGIFSRIDPSIKTSKPISPNLHIGNKLAEIKDK